MLGQYIIKRTLIAIPTLLVISFVLFMIINLPPGSYVDFRIQQMEEEGQADMAEIRRLKDAYHLDRSLPVQYVHWLKGFVTWDLGESFEDQQKVTVILKDLIPMTVMISVFTILLTWAIAIPFGIFAAVRQNSVWDYLLTFIGLAAMATPGFVLALVFMLITKKVIGPTFDPTGLFSAQFQGAAWSWAKVVDLLRHIWIPVVILGVAGTAGMIRILRANVIDELRKQYVLCARARGIHPVLVVMRYPVRVAINPMVSNIGLILPRVISGSVIISIVLQLETLGPRLFAALLSQDTYIAADIIFIQCILAIVGILLSDILLAVVDPRIKFGSK